jgi:hypothetical protein
MLAMADYSWFEKYLGDADEKKPKTGAANVARKPKLSRTEGYESQKKIWEHKLIKIFLKYFPKVRV